MLEHQRKNEVVFSLSAVIDLCDCSFNFLGGGWVGEWVVVINGSHVQDHIQIIIMIVVIYIVWYLTDQGEHTALYKINKNVYIKSQIIYNTAFHDLGISFGISSREITGMCQDLAQLCYVFYPYCWTFLIYLKKRIKTNKMIWLRALVLVFNSL